MLGLGLIIILYLLFIVNLNLLHNLNYCKTVKITYKYNYWLMGNFKKILVFVFVFPRTSREMRKESLVVQDYFHLVICFTFNELILRFILFLLIIDNQGLSSFLLLSLLKIFPSDFYFCNWILWTHIYIFRFLTGLFAHIFYRIVLQDYVKWFWRL